MMPDGLRGKKCGSRAELTMKRRLLEEFSSHGSTRELLPNTSTTTV
jgi:hypothetical protein